MTLHRTLYIVLIKHIFVVVLS